MPERPIVTHLVDDTTAGGVMRVLDFIRTAPEMSDIADCRFVRVTRGKISLRRFDGDVIVSNLALSWRTLPALCALRVANPKATLIHVEHSYTEAFVAQNVPNKRRFHAMLAAAFALFDRVVAVSEGQGAWLRREGLCPEAKLSIIRSCVDLSPFEAIRAPNPRPKVFGAIGRLDRQKGFDTLIEAFRKIPNPDIALHVYGEGVEMPRLRALAGGDARIQFKGFCADPLKAFEAVDVVVIPSRWEAYGLVAIEAVCAGRQVLCADVDGLQDHGSYGAQLMDAVSADQIVPKLETMAAATWSPPAGARSTVSGMLKQDFVHGWQRVLRATGEGSASA